MKPTVILITSVNDDRFFDLSHMTK